MFQLPKNEHTTLPSVENWYTNTNILKLPPKAVFTRRKDKVGEDLQITGWIDDSGDRICEGVSRFSRGVNPMVSVSYSNYNAGTNSNPLTYSAKTEASLPYKAFDNGAFRPPVQSPQDLLPLSRLPRNRTSVLSNPEFPNYLKKMENPLDLRPVKKEVLHTNVRPSAYMRVDLPRCAPTDVMDNIKDQLIIPVTAGVRTGDITALDVRTPTKEIIETPIHINANTVYGSESTVIRTIDQSNFNTNKYIQDGLSGNMNTNVSAPVRAGGIEKRFDRGVKDELVVIPFVPNVRGSDKYVFFDTDMELDRKLPVYTVNTNVSDMSKAKNIRHTNLIELDSKIMTSAFSNPGSHSSTALDNITSREAYLAPSLHKGSFDNKGFMPTTMRQQMQGNVDPLRQNLKQTIINMQQARF